MRDPGAKQSSVRGGFPGKMSVLVLLGYVVTLV